MDQEFANLLLAAHAAGSGDVSGVIQRLQQLPPEKIVELLATLASSELDRRALNRNLAAEAITQYLGSDNWLHSVDLVGLHAMNVVRGRIWVDDNVLQPFVGYLCDAVQTGGIVALPGGDEFEIVTDQPEGVWLVALGLAVTLDKLSVDATIDSLGAYVKTVLLSGYQDASEARQAADPKHRFLSVPDRRTVEADDRHLPDGAHRVTVVRRGSRPEDHENALLVVRTNTTQTSYRFTSMAELLHWLRQGPQCLQQEDVDKLISEL